MQYASLKQEGTFTQKLHLPPLYLASIVNPDSVLPTPQLSVLAFRNLFWFCCLISSCHYMH